MLITNLNVTLLPTDLDILDFEEVFFADSLIDLVEKTILEDLKTKEKQKNENSSQYIYTWESEVKHENFIILLDCTWNDTEKLVFAKVRLNIPNLVSVYAEFAYELEYTT